MGAALERVPAAGKRHAAAQCYTRLTGSFTGCSIASPYAIADEDAGFPVVDRACRDRPAGGGRPACAAPQRRTGSIQQAPARRAAAAARNRGARVAADARRAVSRLRLRTGERFFLVLVFV